MNTGGFAEATRCTGVPFVAVTIVGTRLVGVDAIGIVQALFCVGCDARRATAADIARMVIRADRRCGVSITNDGPTTMRATGFSWLPGAVVKLFTAATNVGFIKKAFKRPLG